jgi:thiamine-phosphate pyrophosphorylase
VLYLCAPASAEAAVEAALEGGLDLLQLRDPDADLATAVRWRELAHRHGARFVVNDDPELARAAEADGLHLGQDDGDRGDFAGFVGRSTHAPEQALRVTDDYLSVGPVWATPTKPGRPATGLDYVRWAAANVTDRPWFAIGGIDRTNIGEVVAAGARHVVVVRAILEAADPAAAARELRAALDA